MNVEEIITNLVEQIVQAFKASGYPYRPLHLMLADNFEIEIRHPPSAPPFLMNKYENIADVLKACPSLEIVTLPEALRGQGFFNKLVSVIGNIPEVEAVCVSNVSNESFSKYLEESERWERLGDMVIQPFPSYFLRVE